MSHRGAADSRGKGRYKSGELSSNPLAYIEANQQDLTGLLQSLIRIPTVNPPGRSYEQIVDLLAARCVEMGLVNSIYQVPQPRVDAVTGIEEAPPRFNVVSRWDVGVPDTVHFNSHYDVVPAAGSWRFAGPFDPGIAAGSVYGRGSNDMKGSIAALLFAIEALQRTGRKPAFNVECSFTADEETGGDLGAGYLVENGLVDADYVVVCEGASGTKVGCGHNGVLWLRVDVGGKSAHAAVPEDGVNAFEGMSDLVRGLAILKKDLALSRHRFTDFNGEDRSPTINIGGVFGGSKGDKINTVPGKAHFSIDRRVLPHEDIIRVEKELEDRILSLARRRRDLRFSTETLLRIEPCVADPSQYLPSSFARAVQVIRRHPATFRCTPGFTDLHFFVAEGGMQGIGYGVGGQNGHGVDERVKIKDLVQTCRVYAQFMMSGIG